MVSPAPIPPDEIARLASLQSYDILGTAPDERFDLFTRLGTWIFGTPFCAIHFVGDETTFFKSAIGFGSYEPPRKTSICAHAVGLDEPVMAIEDLSQDPRFHDHPLVLKKDFRFYAGALLRSSSNHALGTLCIADVKPRILTTEESQRLQALASGVVSVLELHRCSLELLEAANRDPLTKLFNRRHFETALHRSVERARYDAPFTLVFLDLDQFKPINDTLGHAAGDAVLCEIARRLLASVRLTDLVARLAGDEFVMLIQGIASESEVARIATTILAAIAAPFAFEGQDIQMTASIGMTLCPRHASTPPELMRYADAALYDAKRAGRRCFRIYQPPPRVDPRLQAAYFSG